MISGDDRMEGMSITSQEELEGMRRAGRLVGLAADGWTYATLDGSLTAHYEHTIVVTNDAPIILTAAA
jgi:methionine aminopeptidase